jgi:hypothetical protein
MRFNAQQWSAFIASKNARKDLQIIREKVSIVVVIILIITGASLMWTVPGSCLFVLYGCALAVL